MVVELNSRSLSNFKYTEANRYAFRRSNRYETQLSSAQSLYSRPERAHNKQTYYAATLRRDLFDKISTKLRYREHRRSYLNLRVR